MKSNYRYQLDKSSKKHICPNCGKKRFVRYFDNEDKQLLPEIYGKCDRSDHCQYHRKPERTNHSEYIPQQTAKPQPLYFISESVLNKTLKDYDKNTFVQNLLNLAAVEDVQKIIELYRLGTIGEGERLGACTFPFIDRSGNIRTIQVKKFDATNHTQGKPCTISCLLINGYARQGKQLPGWLNDFTKNEKQFTCLFGEHLLNEYPSNPVALVEAPKTAIISALYYGLPESPTALLWLAVYNKKTLTVDKCKALAGRKVVLFPDLNAFKEWNTRTQELKAKIPGTKFIVSDLLERNATPAEINSGLDLADYLTRFNYWKFRQILSEQDIHTSIKQPLSKPQFVPIPNREDVRRDYVGTDGIIHTHFPL
ncbi:MAG: DUF6371 domain-containing protein [Bacteroidota bacterium]